MEQLKKSILHLLAACLLCAATAFFFPGMPGTILSGITIALASIVAVLSISGLVYIMTNRVFSAD